MLKKSLVLASLVGASFAAQAVTVDLRHEYIDSGSNADRVAVSHRFANGFGFSVEAKWKSGGDKADRPFSDTVGNGHEDQISWRWKATDNIALTPGFTLESNDSRTIYKPFLHAQYSFDNGFYVAARYRYDYTRYPSSAEKDDDKVNRGDAWLGWVMGDFRTYDYTLALRGVTTTDFMTADWARIPYEVLDVISNRIINEVQNINIIVYDITSKPPATIEWE